MPIDGKLFRNLSLRDVEKYFGLASQHLNIKVVPRAMRHAGPSHDAFHNKMTLQDIQSRGRWLCVESCRTYMKPAALLRSVANLNRAQLVCARKWASVGPDKVLAALQRSLGTSGSVGSLKRKIAKSSTGRKRPPTGTSAT